MLVNKKKIHENGFPCLSEEEIYQIHLASLEILERTGVEVFDDEAMRLLKEAGCHVDGSRVRIPNHLVNGQSGRSVQDYALRRRREPKAASVPGSRLLRTGHGLT